VALYKDCSNNAPRVKRGPAGGGSSVLYRAIDGALKNLLVKNTSPIVLICGI